MSCEEKCLDCGRGESNDESVCTKCKTFSEDFST